MNKKTFFLALILGTFFCINYTSADSYDIYVDENYKEDDSDGTSEKPYEKISKAIEKSSSKGKKIYIKNGTYKEGLTLGKGIKLYGQDQNKTIIENSGKGIVAKGDNYLKNLSIVGGSSGIIFESSGEMEKCTIKKASGIGIDLLSNSSQFKIKDSKISDNSKGMYAQRGRKIEIIGNEVINNREEGLDLRNKIRGIVQNNTITNNGESGIEIIIGSSDISIINNNIRSNGSSGIATQFYDDFDKSGEIRIKNNTLSKNKSFGINCKNPSGGSAPKDYWGDSISLNNNEIEENREGTIANKCKIKNLSPEEKKAEELKIIKAKEEIEKINTTDAEKLKKEEEERLRIEEENRIAEEKKIKVTILDNQFNELIKENQKINGELVSNKENILKNNKIKLFFFGNDQEKIKVLSQNIKEIDSKINQLESLNKELESLGNTEKININNEKINSIKNQINDYETFKEDQINKKGIFDWFFGFFRK